MFTSFHGWHDTLEQQQKKILSEPKKYRLACDVLRQALLMTANIKPWRSCRMNYWLIQYSDSMKGEWFFLPSVDKLRKKDSVIWRLDNFKWFSPSNMLEQQSDLGNQAHSCTQLNFIEHALEQAYNKHNYIELPRTISLSGSSSSPTVSKTHPSGFF